MQSETKNYKSFLWVELIGFDNTQADYGVGAYIENAGFVPDAMSLFVFNPEIVHTHDGTIDDRLLPFDCGSYGGHPASYERQRQDWTQAQLLGLVQELQKRGVAVFFSVFDIFVDDPWMRHHPEILTVYNDGTRTTAISPFKRLADGSLYEDFYVKQVAAVLRDYGFDGYHQADGYCHPRFQLDKADYSADLAGQFEDYSGMKLPDDISPELGDEQEVVVRRAAWIWSNIRAQWIKFMTERMVQFCTKSIAAVHGEGRKIVFNNALTRDPFQALYRHGVDYQRIAAAGADGFIIETVAPGVILGGEGGLEANPHFDFQAMLMCITAAVPEHKLWCLNNTHDVHEAWDVLRHGPTLLEREIYCQSSLFHWQDDGSMRRCITGPLVCLSDGVRRHEWQWLQSWWGLGYSAQPEGIIGATMVWSDTAQANQLEDYLSTRRFSTHKLLYELMSHSTPVNAVVNVKHVAAASGPLLVLNPHLFAPEELEAVLAYKNGPIIVIGGLPESLPEPDLRFDDCHAPGNLSCAIYGVKPDVEINITDEPEDIPQDLMNQPEPPYYFRELYFRKVSDSFLNTCASIIKQVCGQIKINYWEDFISVRALKIGPGKLRLYIGNDKHHYLITELEMHKTVINVQVMTDFPGTPPPVVGSRICSVRVPGKGMIVLDVELES